jgi:hypothetical protein
MKISQKNTGNETISYFAKIRGDFHAFYSIMKLQNLLKKRVSQNKAFAKSQKLEVKQCVPFLKRQKTRKRVGDGGREVEGERQWERNSGEEAKYQR